MVHQKTKTVSPKVRLGLSTVLLYCSGSLDQQWNSVAVEAFTIVIRLTLKSRQNDKKTMFVLAAMKHMMEALSE